MKLAHDECALQLRKVVAFTPKGGCPLKLTLGAGREGERKIPVAFTPKGGCPLKRLDPRKGGYAAASSSIHPQGWVPIETAAYPRS